jgi:hypothetical protein
MQLAAPVFDFLENLIVHTASYPPLQQAQERGTHFLFRTYDFKGWATRPGDDSRELVALPGIASHFFRIRGLRGTSANRAFFEPLSPLFATWLVYQPEFCANCANTGAPTFLFRAYDFKGRATRPL